MEFNSAFYFFLLNGNLCANAAQQSLEFFSKKIKCTLQLKSVRETLFLTVDNGEGLNIAGFN